MSQGETKNFPYEKFQGFLVVSTEIRNLYNCLVVGVAAAHSMVMTLMIY